MSRLPGRSALVLLLVPALLGATQEPASEPIPFRHLTIADGLSQSAISAIVQDHRGFMWFGTKDGLNRYDGHNFVVYHRNAFEPGSLPDNEVTALFEDRLGRLWVGGRSGTLGRFDRGADSFVDVVTGLGAPVVGLAQDRAGSLWVATDGAGLVRLSWSGEGADPAQERFRHDPHDPRSLGSDRVNSVLLDRHGILWVGSRGGLDRLDPAERRFTAYRHAPGDGGAPGLMTDAVFGLLEDRQGRLWVGSIPGVSVLDADRVRIRHYRHRYDGHRYGWGEVRSILEDRAGLLWLATPSELMRFDPVREVFTYHRQDPLTPWGINTNLPTALYQDRSDVIWVGTNGFGVNIHDPKAMRFGSFVRPDDRPWRVAGFSVYTIFEDAAGALWIDAGLLYRWDRATGAITSFQTRSDRPDDFGNTGVWALLEHPEGFLWAGTVRGLYHYEVATGRARHYRHDPAEPDGLPEPEVKEVFRDPDGTIWVVTDNYLAELVDPAAGRFRSLPYNEPPTSDEWTFPSLTRTADGIFWFGSTTGLVRFDPATRTFRRFRNDPSDPGSLGHDGVRSILPDPREPARVLWVGTAGGGLNRFDLETERFTHYTTADGLPNNVVYGILPDDDGHLWLSTNRGLSRFDPGDGTFRNFDSADGLQGNEFNSGAYFRSASGELFFGGLHGLNHFRPERIRDNPHVPPVVITGFRRNNRIERPAGPGSVLERSITETREIRLSHRDNLISFEFAALDYSAPSKNRFEYRLRGFSDAWIEAGAVRSATFTNLPPGAYRFEVRGSNNDGVWNEAGASIALTVLPRWWWNRWAIALYALSLLAVGFGARRHEMRRIRLEHQLEREREAATQLRELDRARSRFFANVSHEFRTPLTLTLGPLDDLRTGFHGELSPVVAGQVELAHRNAERVLRLIEQLLEVARLEAGHTRLQAGPLDLGAYLGRMVDAMTPMAARRSVLLSLVSPAAPIEIWADPGQLEQAFNNLLSNAIRFTPAGGGVRVSVATAGGSARVAVHDSGPGIPPAELPRIFDRFYRGERPWEQTQPGTGIGLALAREVVQLHGGSIEVTSEVGVGSTFTVNLPLGSDHLSTDQQVGGAPLEEWSPRPPPDLAHIDGGGPLPDPGDAGEVEAVDRSDADVTTILVVEDNADVRAFVRRHLGGRYRVLEAENGTDGLELARARLPDLVISDVMMPGMDGFELCHALKSDIETDFIPVILLTARAGLEDRLTGLREQADDYLTKPFEVEELLTRIHNLIVGRKRLRERYGGGDPGHAALPIHPAPATLPPGDARFLEQVRDAVAEHMGDETFGVEALARRVAHSRSHLHRRLSLLTDESPSDLIRRLRLERAAQLLAAGAGSVSRIAYEVGFKSVAHFSNRFQEHFGVRPSLYVASRLAVGTGQEDGPPS